MIAKCAQCQTAYNIDDSLVKSNGTRFRCSTCKHIFKIYPPEQAANPAPATASPAPGATPTPPPVGGATPTPRPARKSGDASQSRQEWASMTMVNFSEEAFKMAQQRESRYIDLGLIGEGGMGEVRLAKDKQLLRKVAVKVLKKEAASPAALSYFLREAQITAQLDHPNIVPIYTVKQPDTAEQNVSFVMKLIKGKTLADIIRKARKIVHNNPKADLPPDLNLDARLNYFLKICEGMIYAHRKEVVHRDLKPSNVMIGDYGEVYIMDWGIAKMVKEIPETLYGMQKLVAQKSKKDLYVGGSELGSVVGTPGYISPEQVKGLPEVGTASDQFSMGVILYELVTLRPGRPGDMMQKLKWAEDGFINQMTYVSGEKKIAPELEAIINKATALDPKDRYPSVAELADDVRRFLRGEEVSEMPDSVFRKAWRWMNKHRHLTAIVVLSALCLSSIFAIWALWNEQQTFKAARAREKKLTHLLTKVAAQAHFIDSKFTRLEGLLAGLANSAMFMIEEGEPNDERLYWWTDFQQPATSPPDTRMSQVHKKEISIEYPVTKLAPGVDRETVMPIMSRLAPLRKQFKKTMLDSRGSFSPVTEEEAERLIMLHGLPISWVYMGLEVGVMYSYPGKGSYAADYDPRVRPWYDLGRQANGVVWGNPYIDIQGLGRVLPCVMPLRDRAGRFYGVAAIDVTYDTIIEEALTRAGSVGVVESYLLDEQARVVVRSSQLDMDLSDSPQNAALKLPLFPFRQVVSRIRRNESGLVEIDRKNRDSLIIFFHEIPSLGWYYVEETLTKAILAPEER